MKQWRELEKQVLKLNYENCVIRTKSCSFFGNTYTPEGVKPDPKKGEAIKKMEAPQTKQELQSFFGYDHIIWVSMSRT